MGNFQQLEIRKSGNSKIHWLTPFLLAGFVILMVIRVPEILWPGRFWAEEGSVYFLEACTNPPGVVLLKPHLGYYSFFNKVSVLAAAHAVPLVLAPVVTVLFALAAQMLPILLLLSSKIDSLPSIWRKVCAALLILIIQPNKEVWLNTINSQFFFCIAAAIILISQPISRARHLFRLVILLVAGLTGVVSCLLLPFFLFEYAQSRSARRLHEVTVLSFTCIIQGAVVLTHAGRETASCWNVLPFALLTKQWILPFMGNHVADTFAAFVKQHRVFEISGAPLAAFSPYLVAGIVMAMCARKEAILLYIASISIASISFLKSLDASTMETSLFHVSALHGGRYYYAPNVLLAFALLMEPRPLPPRRAAWERSFKLGTLTLIASLLFMGTPDYFLYNDHWIFEGPSWPQEVQSWREGKSKTLRIWPPWWNVPLPAKDATFPIQQPESVTNDNAPSGKGSANEL